MGVTVNGERAILRTWAGDGQEGARFWLQVFSELKNRGVEDVLIAVCDGLKGLPEAINTTWEHTVVQQCIVHLIRNSFRYAGRQHRDAIVRSLKPVYTAPSEAAALKCLYLVTRSLDPTSRGTLDDQVKARAEPVRDHLRRTVREHHPLMKTTGSHTPFNGQTLSSRAASVQRVLVLLAHQRSDSRGYPVTDATARKVTAPVLVRVRARFRRFQRVSNR